MAVYEDFGEFFRNIAVFNLSDIRKRTKAITKRLNSDFWDSDSETLHRYYVGSYGRGTAIDGFSDLDLLFELPNSLYHQYDAHTSNGQSALLQAVKKSIAITYSTTTIGADGQVVVITFTDMDIELVPAFINKDKVSFTYPDSNDGGSWKVTKPLEERDETERLDIPYKGNLRRIAQMTRAWKNKHNVPMGGLLIDTLAANFLSDYTHRNEGLVYYDWFARDFFDFLANQNPDQNYWYALGSKQTVYRKGSFEYKAKVARNLAIEAISHYSNENHWAAKQKMREIFGTNYPS